MALVNDWQATQTAILTSLIAPPLAADGIDYVAVWGYQTGDLPPNAVLVMLHISSIASVTPDPETSQAYVPANPNGQQIVLTSRDHTEFTLDIDIFSRPNAAGASDVGALSAKYIGQRINTWLSLSEEEYQGMSVVDSTPVASLPVLLESKYESRARMSVRLRLVDGASVKLTWIETVVGPTGSLT